MTTILLGPQRFRTTAGTAVRSLGVEGSIATVTAGWQDREGDDSELNDVLEGRSHNLDLYQRLIDVLDTDQHFAAAALAHRDAVDELAGIYSQRLQHALDSVYAVQRRAVRADIADAAFTDGIAEVRAIDSWFLTTLDQLYGELEMAAPVGESEPVQRHRGEVAGILHGAGALVIAGGHVGLLLRCLKLFDVVPPAELPVVAWSAGAMALTDRVVLYNDRGPRGVVGSEVWDRGLRRAPGIVAMPHARRRLQIDDPLVLRVLVRRFAGARCLLLDDGARVDLGPDGALPDGARVISDYGTVGTVGGLP
jgi:hypothetical protein